MHSIHRCLFAITLLASSAQAQVPTQARAPISPLGSIIGKAPVTFDTLINVRGLSDGRIIINDAVGHKLVTLDASFTVVTVWSDTTGNTKYNYGTQPAVIMPVSGDSSVMLEARSNSLVMIDPQGTFGRVFALPKTSDAANVALSTMYGGGGIDPNGRLVYFGRPDPIAIPNPGCAASKPKLTADSVSLLRANFETRQIDTIGRLRFSLLTGTLIASTTNPGCWEWQRKIDVLPYHGDQWARPLPPNAPAGFRFPPPAARAHRGGNSRLLSADAAGIHEGRFRRQPLDSANDVARCARRHSLRRRQSQG